MQAAYELGADWSEWKTARLYPLLKRTLDVSVAVVLLVLLLPVLAACTLAILLDSRGPVFFRQQRLGERGRPFTMVKFRSMRADASTAIHQEFVAAFIRGEAPAQDGADGPVYKLTADPRVTRVGAWLRRTSLDELPQLWNVVRGQMSLVGPRPPLPYEVACYSPAHLERLTAKPGITGLWQVSGRSATSFDEMVALDVAYIRNRSLLLDLVILLRTLPAVLSARGAH